MNEFSDYDDRLEIANEMGCPLRKKLEREEVMQEEYSWYNE